MTCFEDHDDELRLSFRWYRSFNLARDRPGLYLALARWATTNDAWLEGTDADCLEGRFVLSAKPDVTHEDYLRATMRLYLEVGPEHDAAEVIGLLDAFRKSHWKKRHQLGPST